MGVLRVRQLLARLEEQSARIERLEARSVGAAAVVQVEAPDESVRRPSRMSRRGMLTSAAAGTVGLVGALLVESEGTASAAGLGNFTSTTSTAAVTATNTGTGDAITATSKAGPTIDATQNSTAAFSIAVRGTNKSTKPGYGVIGSAISGVGVDGSCTSGTGVIGTSTSGVGVSGSTASTAANAAAIVGTVTSKNPGSASAGVSGVNNGTGGSGIGVSGTQNGSGYGVFGFSPSGLGVFGESSNGTGVLGSSGGGAGVSGESTGSYGVHGDSESFYGVYGTSPDNYAVAGISTNGLGVYGEVSKDTQAGVVGRTLNATGNYGVYSFGNIGATGTKSAVVPALDGGDHLTLYCVESPECWFEDFGSARLTNGAATVAIDAEFAQTIHTDKYHVFAQAEGDCKGLSVQEKTATGFVVRELDGGASNVTFAFRIVALRRDVHAPRLHRTTLPEAKSETT
jgi:hypothetical protein